jgi:hypothetical protein
MNHPAAISIPRAPFRGARIAIGKTSGSLNSHLATLRTSVTNTRKASPKTGHEPVQVAL